MESIVMYKSFFDSARVLEPEQYKELMDAIARYAYEDIEPEEMSPLSMAMYQLIKPQIDATKKKREAGKIGGKARKIGGKARSASSKPQAEAKQSPSNDNVNVNDNDNGIKKENIKEKVPMNHNELFDHYPKPVTNRMMAERELVSALRYAPYDDIVAAIINYAEAVKILETEDKFIKDMHNFFKDGYFLAYTPEQYIKPKPPTKKKTGFQDMPQSDIDFDELEAKIFAN